MAFLCAFIFFCDTFLFELLSAFILGTIDRVAVCVWNLFCLEFCLSILNIFCKFTAKNDVCHASYTVQRDLLYKDNRTSIIIQSVAQKTKNNNEWTSEFEKKYCELFSIALSYAGRVQKCIWISEQMSKTNAKHALETNRQRIRGDKQHTHTHSHTQAKRIVLWVEQLLNFILVLFTYFQFQFLLLICDI